MLGFKLTVLASILGAVVAQQLPQCANTCIGGDTYGTNCKKLDVACICNSAQWIAGLQCCIAKGCNAQEQADTIAYADKICAGAGVTTLPQTATCASTASGSASSGAAVSAATSSSVPASTTDTATTGSGTAAAATTTSSSSRGAAAIQTAAVQGLGALLALAAAL